MPDSPRCPHCGSALADAEEGMCLKCLLLSAAEPRGDEPVEFGGYQLGRRIGAGGMGLVYEARQVELDRTVALKVLAPGLFASREARERFHAEAQAVARLDHPGIVPVYEVGEEDGQPFFSMRLISGGSLAERLKRGESFTFQRCVQILISLSRAVHYAHQRGVLHRDLKPGNVLLDEAGEPWLADFGLARLIGRDSVMTRTQSMIGTPAYMAPEQAGASGEITTAIDVYGLGAILYELLSGRPPFGGSSTLQIVHQVIETEPSRLSTVRSDMPRDLETICLKCLAKDPRHRYASAAALSDDLERWLAGEPILARPASWSEKTVKWIKRHPGWAAALLAISATAIISTALSLRLAHAEQAASDVADMRRLDLVRFHMAEADRLLAAGDSAQAMLWQCRALELEESATAKYQQPTAITYARQRISWIKQQLPVLKQLWVGSGCIHHASFSADEKRLALAIEDRVLVVEPESGHEVLAEIEMGDEVNFVKLDTTGKKLVAITRQGTATLMQASTGVKVIDRMPCTASEAYFSPDGMRLLLGTAEGPRWFDAETGTALGSTKSLSAALISLSPSGKSLAWSHGDDFYVRDSATGSDRILRTKEKERLRSIAWSADDSRVLFVKEDGGIRQHLAATGERVGKPLQPGAACFKASYNHDGLRILSIGPGVTKLWDSETGHGVSSELAPDLTTDASFNRAGTHVAVAGEEGQARLWRQARSQPGSPLLWHTQAITGIFFAPQTGHVLTISSDHTARLWKMPTHEPPAPFWNLRRAITHMRLDATETTLQVQTTDGQTHTWDLRRNQALTQAATAAAIIPLPSQNHSVQLCTNDGRHFFTADPQGRIQHWTLDVLHDTCASLQAQAELLTAHRLAPLAGLTPLNTVEITERIKAGVNQL
jgi:eukaryotic-like serine/threonine-protein kinase